MKRSIVQVLGKAGDFKPHLKPIRVKSVPANRKRNALATPPSPAQIQLQAASESKRVEGEDSKEKKG